MMIFVYTFVIIFASLIVIFGFGSFLAGDKETDEALIEGEATAAMCTTQLLDRGSSSYSVCDEDFVIEQDMVYTYDSFNL